MPNEAIAGWALGMRMREQRLAEESRKAQAARLQELDQRREALEAAKTLADVLDLPKARRGPSAKLAGQIFGTKYNMDADTLTSTAAQLDDETSKALGAYVRSMGLKIGQGEADPRALLEVMKPDVALPHIIRAAQEAETRVKAQERGAILSEPKPTDPGTAVPQGWQPKTPKDALDVLQRQEEDLTAKRQKIAALHGGLPDEAERYFTGAFARIKDARERLAPKPPGSEVDLAYRAAGDDQQATRAMRLMREGKPDTYANEAERIAGELYDAPFARLTKEQRGVVNRRVATERVDLAREQGRAAAMARLEVPDKPTAGQVEKLAEFDASVIAVRDLLAQKDNPAITSVLGMSPKAIGTRWAAGYFESVLTDEQSIFLSQLAETAGTIRRVLVGQAQTVPEMKSLLPLLPKESDPPDRVFAKLQAIMKGMESKRGAFENALRRSNVRVPDRPTSPASPPGPRSQSFTIGGKEITVGAPR